MDRLEMLTLTAALMSGRLPEFIAQEEARDVGPINRAAFDGAVSNFIKGRRSEDRTSRPASGGGLTGKKIRPDI